MNEPVTTTPTAPVTPVPSVVTLEREQLPIVIIFYGKQYILRASKYGGLLLNGFY